MSRYRIDFSIRELDVPEDQARGIRFGDDVEESGIMDFFDRCRDAARTLFMPSRKKDTVESLQKELDEIRKKSVLQQHVEKMKTLVGVSTKPRDPYAEKNWDYDELSKMDDGSRGGDGPPSEDYLRRLKAAADPNRGRY